MQQVLVKFEEVEQIIDFVNVMSQCEYEADVKWGSIVVDAKSLVGVMSLAKAKTVELILHTEDCGNLMEKIAVYAA